MTTINLRDRFGSEFHVWRECHDDCRQNPEEFDRVAGSDPHRMIIPCQFGHFYVHGDQMLGASTKSRGPTAKRLSALLCVRVVQDADDGINVIFDAADFDAVAEIMKPRRRRRLTAEHKAKLAQSNLGHRFTPASGARSRGLKRAPAA